MVKKKEMIRQIIAHIFLCLASIVFILPFVWLVSTSLKPDEQIFAFPLIWIPDPFKWSNYPIALEYFPFLTCLKNTLYITIPSVIGTLISCSLVAYGFSRIKWVGRDILFFILLSTLMLPFQVTMIPLFVIFKQLAWINTFKPLYVPTFFGTVFFIFLLRQFFLTIPMELSDAAKIDGASEFFIYSRVLLPLSKPALGVVALFQFIWRWNDFLGPLIYLHDESKYPISLGLEFFQGEYEVEWSLLMAASTVTIVPIIILFFLTQRTFIQGISLTGIKE